MAGINLMKRAADLEEAGELRKRCAVISRFSHLVKEEIAKRRR